MSRDWTPIELYINRCYLKLHEGTDLMDVSFQWDLADRKPFIPAPSSTPFPFVNFLFGERMVRDLFEDKNAENVILGALENDIKLSIDSLLDGSYILDKENNKIFFEKLGDDTSRYSFILDDEVIRKWLNGELSSGYYSEPNHFALQEYLKEQYDKLVDLNFEYENNISFPVDDDIDEWGSIMGWITIENVSYGVEYNLCRSTMDSDEVIDESAFYKIKPFVVDGDSYSETDYDSFIPYKIDFGDSSWQQAVCYRCFDSIIELMRDDNERELEKYSIDLLCGTKDKEEEILEL